MADNVTLNAGAGGATVKTDDISGVHIPASKIVLGADNTDGGYVSSANPLPVSDAGGSLTVDGTVAVSGTVAVTDNSSTLSVDDGGGSLTVDGSVSVSGAVDTELTTADLDTGAGTDTRAVVGLVVGASGGGVLVSTTNPLPVGDNGSTLSVDDGGGSLTVDGSVSVSGTVPVTDNGGSLTVDGSVSVGAALPAGDNNIGNVDLASEIPAGDQTIGRVKLTDGTNVVGVANVSPGALAYGIVARLGSGDNNIGDVDVASVTPGTGATNLGKAEDAAHTSGDVGVMALGVRRDANTTLVGADGDYAPLQVNADGSLKVAITAGAGSGGTSATDDAAFTPGSGSGTPVMGLADETSPDSVDEGDVGVVRMTLARGLHVNLRDASGAEVSVGGGTQYDEDTAHVSGDKVTMAGVVRADTAASLAGTDGDRTALIVDASGRLHVNGSGVTQPVSDAGGSLTVDGTVTVQDGGGAISVDDNGGSLTVDGSVSITGAVDTELTTADLDTGAGTDTRAVVGLVYGASGGGTLVSTTNPLPVGDNGGTLSVDDGGASLTVDGAVSLAAAIPAGTNNIGDVDVLSVVPGTGAADLGKAEDAAHASGDTGVFVLGVRQDTPAGSTSADGDYSALKTDSVGRLHVNGSGVTQPVSDAGGSLTVDNGGTFVTQENGAALTALQLIDDPVFADDVAFTPGTSKVGAIGCLADETSADSVDEGDIGIPRMTLDRKQHVVTELETNSIRDSGTSRTPKFAIIDAATSGDNTILAAVASRKIRVLSLFVVASAAVTARFESGAGGTALTGQMQLAANGGFVLPFNPYGWFETAVNTLLNLELSGAISVDGGLQYVEVA